MAPADSERAVVVVQRSALLSNSGFSHGFSTRKGGVSLTPYDTADFALLRDPAALHENTGRLARAVGFDPKRLWQTRQVHGARVVSSAEAPGPLRDLDADALVGVRSGDAVMVRVADCVPVLIADARSGQVAAVHAGWKGVVAGVVGAALEALGENTGQRVAAIGPCIGRCCFEVGDDVARQIELAAGDVPTIASRHRASNGDAKALVDLRAAVRGQLVARGLDDAAIEDVGGCTRCDAELFYSYRRDGDASGRLAGVIVARARHAQVA